MESRGWTFGPTVPHRDSSTWSYETRLSTVASDLWASVARQNFSRLFVPFAGLGLRSHCKLTAPKSKWNQAETMSSKWSQLVFVPHQSATAAFVQNESGPLFRNTVPGVKARWPTLAVTHCGCVASGQTGKLQVVQCSYFIVPSLSHDPTPTVTSEKKKQKKTKPLRNRSQNMAAVKQRSCEYTFGCCFFCPLPPPNQTTAPI